MKLDLNFIRRKLFLVHGKNSRMVKNAHTENGLLKMYELEKLKAWLSSMIANLIKGMSALNTDKGAVVDRTAPLFYIYF